MAARRGGRTVAQPRVARGQCQRAGASERLTFEATTNAQRTHGRHVNGVSCSSLLATARSSSTRLMIRHSGSSLRPSRIVHSHFCTSPSEACSSSAPSVNGCARSSNQPCDVACWPTHDSTCDMIAHDTASTICSFCGEPSVWRSSLSTKDLFDTWSPSMLCLAKSATRNSLEAPTLGRLSMPLLAFGLTERLRERGAGMSAGVADTESAATAGAMACWGEECQGGEAG